MMLNFFLKRINKKEKGFTLVELIIVMAVIGVLAAVVAPKGLQMIDKSKQTKAIANIKAVKTAAILYYSETGTAATTDANINGYLDNPILGTGAIDGYEYAISSGDLEVTCPTTEDEAKIASTFGINDTTTTDKKVTISLSAS